MLGKILKIKSFIFLFLFIFSPLPFLRAQTSSGGIGVILENLPDKKIHRIRAVFKESPAARAKIVAGDEILSIDGTSTTGISFEELGKKIKGPIGTAITLELRDPKTQSTRKVQITRSSSQSLSPLIVKDTPVFTQNNNPNALSDQEREEVKSVIRKLTTEEQKKKMNDLLIEFKNGKLIKGDFLQILRKTF